MIQQRLLEWIRHPELLDKESLHELREILARYPYFQTARLLYLKNLFLVQDPDFKKELRESALYVADLSMLFYYIEGERFAIKKHPSVERKEGVPNTDRTLDLIDRFLSDMPERPDEDKLPVQADVNVDYTSILMEEDTSVSGDVPPLKGQELIDNFIERDKGAGKSMDAVTLPDSRQDYVEDAQSEEETDDTKEEDSDERYFTETLAKIYVKQQRYDKALEIIKKLNLKYPKKNTYFADQIRFLEKLIINAKSK